MALHWFSIFLLLVGSVELSAEIAHGDKKQPAAGDLASQANSQQSDAECKTCYAPDGKLAQLEKAFQENGELLDPLTQQSIKQFMGVAQSVRDGDRTGDPQAKKWIHENLEQIFPTAQAGGDERGKASDLNRFAWGIRQTPPIPRTGPSGSGAAQAANPVPAPLGPPIPAPALSGDLPKSVGDGEKPNLPPPILPRIQHAERGVPTVVIPPKTESIEERLALVPLTPLAVPDFSQTFKIGPPDFSNKEKTRLGSEILLGLQSDASQNRVQASSPGQRAIDKATEETQPIRLLEERANRNPASPSSFPGASSPELSIAPATEMKAEGGKPVPSLSSPVVDTPAMNLPSSPVPTLVSPAITSPSPLQNNTSAMGGVADNKTGVASKTTSKAENLSSSQKPLSSISNGMQATAGTDLSSQDSSSETAISQAMLNPSKKKFSSPKATAQGSFLSTAFSKLKGLIHAKESTGFIADSKAKKKSKPAQDPWMVDRRPLSQSVNLAGLEGKNKEREWGFLNFKKFGWSLIASLAVIIVVGLRGAQKLATFQTQIKTHQNTDEDI